MSRSRLVYSTVGGRVQTPDKDRPSVRPSAGGAPADGVIRLFRERGGRNGKVVTVIRGLPSREGLLPLAADLKRLCGAGGTVKGDTLEIQGDHRDRLATWLREKGHTVKLAGG